MKSILVKKFVEVGRGTDRTTKTEFDWMEKFPIEDDSISKREAMDNVLRWCIKRVPRYDDGQVAEIEWLPDDDEIILTFGYKSVDDPDKFVEDGRFYIFYLEE